VVSSNDCAESRPGRIPRRGGRGRGTSRRSDSDRRCLTYWSETCRHKSWGRIEGGLDTRPLLAGLEPGRPSDPRCWHSRRWRPAKGRFGERGALKRAMRVRKEALAALDGQ